MNFGNTDLVKRANALATAFNIGGNCLAPTAPAFNTRVVPMIPKEMNLTNFQTDSFTQTSRVEHAAPIEWLAESLKGLTGTGE